MPDQNGLCPTTSAPVVNQARSLSHVHIFVCFALFVSVLERRLD